MARCVWVMSALKFFFPQCRWLMRTDVGDEEQGTQRPAGISLRNSLVGTRPPVSYRLACSGSQVSTRRSRDTFSSGARPVLSGHL